MSSKQSSEAAIVTVLDANKILAPVNIVKETGFIESRTTLVAQNVIIQSIRRSFICPQTACILSHVPSLDLTQSRAGCSIITPPAGQSFKFLAFRNYQLSTVKCPEEDRATTCSLPFVHPSGLSSKQKLIPAVLKESGRAPQITKIERSIATTFTKTVRVNITSCNKPFESSPKKLKEEHERRSDEPKGGNRQPTIVSSEHRLSLANNRQFVDLDGEKEVPTRKRTGVKNYRHW